MVSPCRMMYFSAAQYDPPRGEAEQQQKRGFLVIDHDLRTNRGGNRPCGRLGLFEALNGQQKTSEEKNHAPIPEKQSTETDQNARGQQSEDCEGYASCNAKLIIKDQKNAGEN